MLTTTTSSSTSYSYNYNYGSTGYYSYGISGGTTKEDNKETYENQILGNWKGNDNMLESIEIVKMYKVNREADIKKRYDAKYEELKSSNKLFKEFTELVNSFEASVTQLYTSQFEEGATESNVDKEVLALINVCSSNSYKYKINESFMPEEAKKLTDEKQTEVNELTETCAAVTTMLKICKGKEEVEEVLARYDIIDKKTKKINLIKI